MLSSNVAIEDQEPCTRATHADASASGRERSLVLVTTPLPGYDSQEGLSSTGARSKWIRNRQAILTRVLPMSEVIARLRPRQKGVCGVTPKPGKKVMLRIFRSGFKMLDLFKCRSKLVCPCCTSENLEQQRGDHKQLLVDNLTLERDSIMVSLSVGFPEETSLKERWGILAKMLGQLGEATPVKVARKAVGRKVTVKVVHLLHGELGWHAHLHLVYLLDRRVTLAKAKQLAEVEIAAWARIAGRHQCVAQTMAQRYRRIGRTKKDCHEVARYLTKALEEIHFGDANVDEGTFRCALDHNQNRSAWQLLNDLTFNDDELALEPLQEWVEMMDSQTRQSSHFPTKYMERLHEEAKLRTALQRAEVLR